jgi:sugar lactone lactonase YvrE
MNGDPVPGATVIDNGLRNSSATITGLPAGAQYTIVVVSTNSSGSSSSTPFTVYAPPAPSAPTESSFSIPTPSVPGAVNYIYSINGSVVAAAPAVPGYSVSGGSVVFTGLPPGVAQSLVVTSVAANNVQTSTPALTVYTTPVEIPASSFRTDTSSQTGITLNWPAGSGATSYKYSITDLNGNPITNAVFSDDGVTFNRATISGLLPGTSYLVTVTPQNSSGAAIPTTFTASTAPPTPPQPTVSAPSQTGFSMPVPSVTGATDYFYTINGVRVYPNVVNGVATFSGLTPGVEQNLVVTAVGPNNVLSPSPPYTIYTTPVTLPITNFNTSDSTSTELRIQWAGYTGATLYEYDVVDSSGNPILGASVIDNGVASNSIRVTGLAPGTQYTVRITPINPSGIGAPIILTAYTSPPAPTPPVAFAPTQTGFRIPTPSVPGATSYIYTVNNIQYTPTTDSSGNLVFTGLPPGVPQNLIVIAVGENNTQAPCPPVTVYTTPVTLPSSAFDTSTSTTTALRIQWTGATGATSYIYVVRDASGREIPGAVVTDNGVGSNSAVVSGLAPGTAYTVTVTARNPSGDSTPIVINASTAPSAPSPAVPSAATQTGFTIPAPSVSGASSYIYRINGVTVTPTVSGGNLVFTGLTPGVAQNLVVTAVASNNAQTSSAPVTIYTEPVPLVASSVTRQATATSVTVSWPPNSTGATVYEYAVLDASGVEIPGVTVVDNGVAFNSATVVGLSPGTVYSLRVTARNPAGTALPTLIPINTAPRVPALPTASAPTTNGFTINAPSSPGALSYTYTINDSVIAPAPASPGYTVSGGNVVFNGLTPGLLQRLVVTAVGPNNTQTPCAAISVYTLPVTLPSSAFTTRAATSTSVAVQWTGVTGATSYIYDVRDASGRTISGAVVTDNGLASNSIVVSGLAPGTAYTVTVTARNPSGDSTPTVMNTFTSPATPPQPVPSAPTQTGFSIPTPSVPGALSYIYLVNGVRVTPTVSGGNLVFTGLTPGVAQTLVVTAVGPNNIEAPSAPLTVYTTPVPVSAGSVTSQPSSNGGTFRWPSGTGATLYEYAVVDSSGNPILGASVLDNGISSNSATVVGVPPGTVYRLLVTARNPSGITTPTSITAYTAPSAPSPPVPSAPTENGFSISAPSAAGALSYIYTINGITVTPTVANGIVTFSGLTAGVLQNLIVTAVGPNNIRTSSVPIQALTKPVSLPSSAFSTPSATPNGVTIRWSGTTGATSYEYSVREANTNPVTGFNVIDNGVSSNFAMITGLAPGKEYKISVAAKNASGASTPTTFTTYTAPAAQALSRALATTTTGFTISAPSAAGALSYIYSVNDVTRTPTVSGDTLVFTGLTPGVIQKLVITSVGLNNLQTPSTPFPIYTTPVSIPLSAFSTIGSSPTGFTIQWTGNTGATAYSYTIRDGSGAPVGTATMTDNGLVSKTVSFGGLSVGIGYRVTVTSTNSADSVASATYIAYTGPPPPTSFVSSNQSQTAFTISWLGGTGATSYTYLVNGGTAITPYQDNGLSGRNAVFRGLTPGATYIIDVTAGDNYGSRSTGRYVIATAPSDVTNVVETAATLTGFTIGWAGGDGATSYKFYFNGQEIMPSIDDSLSGKTVTFSNLALNFDSRRTGVNVTVEARNNSGQNSSSTRGNILTPPATNLTSSQITSDGFTVSWVDDGTVISYFFTLNDVRITPVSRNSTSAVFNNLDPGTQYKVIVYTDNPAPGETPSAPINITTTDAPSQPVIDSTAVPDADITSAGFKIVLPSITGGTAPISFTYTVLDGSGNPANISSSVSNGIATLAGLLPNTAYTVSVRAVDAVGTVSTASTPYAFTSLIGAQKPISLTNTPPTLTTITVSWSLDSLGTVPVRYTYTLNNVLTSGSSSTGSPTTFSGLNFDTTYDIIVRAVDQYDSITASEVISAKTLFSLPLQVTNLDFPSANIGNTRALLTWSGGDYATSFNIVVTSVTTGTTVTPNISTYLTNGNLAVNSAEISGLLAGFTYSVTVQAVNSFGSSPVSAAASVTTTVLVTTFASGLLGPTAITSDGTNLYVAQAITNQYVQLGFRYDVFSSPNMPSNFIFEGNINGKPVLKMDNILRFDSGGNRSSVLYGSTTPIVIDPDNSVNSKLGGIFGITYDSSRSPPIIFVDSGNSELNTCPTDGSIITNILGSVHSHTVDSSGNVYIITSTGLITMTNLANNTIPIPSAVVIINRYTPITFDKVTKSIWAFSSNNIILNFGITSPYGATSYGTVANGSRAIITDMYGNVIISDSGNNRIKILYMHKRPITYNSITYSPSTSASPSIINYAGSGTAGFTNGTLLNSTFNGPWGVQLSEDNTTLYVVDNVNNAVRAMPYVISSIISSLPPTTPTNVVQKLGPPNLITIGWTVIQATSFRYLIIDSNNVQIYPGTATLVTDSLVNNTASFSGLQYGQQYTITVTATNVNGSKDSTATSLSFVLYTSLFSKNSFYNNVKLTVDSSNIVYCIFLPVINYTGVDYTGIPTIPSIIYNCTSSGPIEILRVRINRYYEPKSSVFPSPVKLFRFCPVRNLFVISYYFGNGSVETAPPESTAIFHGYFYTVTIDSNGNSTGTYMAIAGYDSNGNMYKHSHLWDSSNITSITLIKNDTTNTDSKLYTTPVSGVPNTAKFTVDDNGNLWTILASSLTQRDTNGKLLNTYPITYIGGCTDIMSDVYGNIIFITLKYIYIFYTRPEPFLYNGTTYTQNSLIKYAGSSSTSSTFIETTLPSTVFSNLRSLALNPSCSTLYVLDTTYTSIITMPYIFTNLPPVKPYSIYINDTNSSDTKLEIHWLGGGLATYSYSISDPNISVLTNNMTRRTSIILSRNDITGQSFTITITATNTYGTVSSDPFTINWPIYVSTFASISGLNKITFDSDNVLYCKNAKIFSLNSSGVPTEVSSSNYGLMVYNKLLNALVVTGSTLGYIPFTYNGPLTNIDITEGTIYLCTTDTNGVIYARYLTKLIKYIPVPFTSPQLFTKVVLSTTLTRGDTIYLYDMTIDPFGNIWIMDRGTDGKSNITQYDSSFTLMNTYIGDAGLAGGIISDIAGNIIWCDRFLYKINIICKQSTPIIYNGVTYSSGSMFTYAGTTTGNINSQALNSKFAQLDDVKLDNSGKILYVLDTGNGQIKRMAYIINTDTLPPPTQPVLTLYEITPSLLKVAWSGAIGATSYSYSLTNSNGDVSYSISQDNSLKGKFISISASFSIGTDYTLTVTASNSRGSASGTITTGSIKGFVENYKTGLNSPTQMAIGPSNSLYFAQSLNSGDLVYRIKTDGTLTALVSGLVLTKPYGISYNPSLNTLIYSDFNGNIGTSALTGGTTTYNKQTLGNLGGCVCDNSGNIYFLTHATTAFFIRKLTGTTVTNLSISYRAYGITIDLFGNLWVADTTGNQVVKHDITGTVLATYTGFNAPKGLCSDLLGNIIVADSGNELIKIIYTYSTPATVHGVTYTAGNVYTYAGYGNSQLPLYVKFNNPWCPVLDLTNTTLYVSDHGNNSIRSMPYFIFAAVAPKPGTITLSSSSILSTQFTISWTKPLAATSYSYTLTANGQNFTPTITDNGFFLGSAVFSGLLDATSYTLTVTAINAYDSTPSAPINVTTPYTTGVTTFAGRYGINSQVIEGYLPNNLTGYCKNISIDDINNMYVSSNSSSTVYILKIQPDGKVIIILKNIFSNGYYYRDSVVYNNTLYVCNINSSTNVSTILSIPLTDSYDPNAIPNVFATLPSTVNDLYSIAKDTSGNFYVYANENPGPNCNIYKIDSNGSSTVFKSISNTITIKGMVLDNLGNIYYTVNSSSGSINKLTQGGEIIILKTGLNFPEGITISSDYTTLYVADYANHRIVKYVIASNILTVFAGTTGSVGNTDSTTLTSAKFHNPADLILDSTGQRIFVADGNCTIRKIQYN